MRTKELSDFPTNICFYEIRTLTCESCRDNILHEYGVVRGTKHTVRECLKCHLQSCYDESGYLVALAYHKS